MSDPKQSDVARIERLKREIGKLDRGKQEAEFHRRTNDLDHEIRRQEDRVRNRP